MQTARLLAGAIVLLPTAIASCSGPKGYDDMNLIVEPRFVFVGTCLPAPATQGVSP